MKLITRNHYLNKLMDAFIEILENEENANVIRIKLNYKRNLFELILI